jgi:hypothetical protein
MWELSLKELGMKLMEDGGDSGWIEQTDDMHKKKKCVVVLVRSIPLGVEESWQGDFLFLARNISWMFRLVSSCELRPAA